MSLSITPVLQINHPTPDTPSSTERKTPNSESGYFSIRHRKQERASSPGEHIPSVPAGTLSPLGLFNTPAVSEPSSSRHEANFYTPNSHRSLSRHNGTASASDNLSTTSYVSGPISSGARSSDTGRSPCSNSSSEYLEPPEFQGDGDNPPYKPRRQSDDSLSMIRKPRRANTMPDGKKQRRRRHKKHRHKKINMNEHQSQSYWRLPGCQTVPTAPAGQRELCRGHADLDGRSKARGGKARTREPLPSSLRGGSKSTALTRRWSSVEVGAHQILLESTLPTRDIISKLPATLKKDSFIPKIRNQRYRSSSFTRGAIDLDIVRTVREKLTHRKISSTQLETPSSITLRRASREGSPSGIATLMQSNKSNATSDRYSPLASIFGDLHQRRPSAAYLITSKDIDTITELIEANLNRKYQERYGSETYSQSSTANSRPNSLSPSVSGRCYHSKSDPQPKPGVNVADIPPAPDFVSKDYLQVNATPAKMKLSHRVNSSKSFHEVIWEGGKSPSVMSGEEDSDYRESSPVSETGGQYSSGDDFALANPFPMDKGIAFDPNNARVSISEWSGRCAQNEISLVVTSSDSEPNDPSRVYTPTINTMTHPNRPPIVTSVSYPADGNSAQSSARSSASISKGRTSPKIKPFTRYASAERKVQDVVSFPPLAPRKTTNDWFSPLPEMEVAPHLSASRSLHNLGLDTNFGPSSSNTVTPKASQAFQAEASTPMSHARSMDFRNFQQRMLSNPERQTSQGVRRKSIVKPHPKAPPRIGESSTVGSSIGSCTGERRNSGVPRPQRVRTIDNIHKGERDHPCSKWRKPSACPPPMPLSLGEDLDYREQWIPGPETGVQRLSKLRSGLTDRMSVLALKCPPIPKVDCTGIYGSITGARRDDSSRDPCASKRRESCKPHSCDDCERDPRKPSVDWIG